MTIDEWNNYGRAMIKEFEDYTSRSDDYLDAARYMMTQFALPVEHGSAIKPIGKVVSIKESENGITFDIQPIKEKESKPMRQCEIDFEKKKLDLKKEMDQALFDLQTKFEEDQCQIRSEYNQRLLDLEKEKHEADHKEKSDAQAKELKTLYDSYVAAGFTKTDAKEFVTLKLKSVKSNEC